MAIKRYHINYDLSDKIYNYGEIDEVIIERPTIVEMLTLVNDSGIELYLDVDNLEVMNSNVVIMNRYDDLLIIMYFREGLKINEKMIPSSIETLDLFIIEDELGRELDDIDDDIRLFLLNNTNFLENVDYAFLNGKDLIKNESYLNEEDKYYDGSVISLNDFELVRDNKTNIYYDIETSDIVDIYKDKRITKSMLEFIENGNKNKF